MKGGHEKRGKGEIVRKGRGKKGRRKERRDSKILGMNILLYTCIKIYELKFQIQIIYVI